MSSEHSAALKYTTAGQRLEPTLVAPYNGLRPLKQRKPVSRESILTQISLKSSIRSYGTKHTRIHPAQPTFCNSFSSLRRLLQTLPGVLEAWPRWLRSTASSQPLPTALWPIRNRNTCSARHNTTHTHTRNSEIRITMRSEHSAALKYTAAEQRLEPTLA